MDIFREGLLSLKCQAINSLDDAVGLLWRREKDVIVVYLLEPLHIRNALRSRRPQNLCHNRNQSFKLFE